MGVEVRDPQMLELVPEGAEPELVASGFVFTEGPVWVPAEGCLLFSDVPANRRYRWDEVRGASLVSEATGFGNGMTLDRDGRLVVCEAESRAIVRMDTSGSDRVVVASFYQRRALNSPNDVVVASDGAIYFTDPWYSNQLGIDATQELDFAGVFRVVPGKEPELAARGFQFPNGLCFSPDESLLYVNDSRPSTITVFDVASDGSLGDGRPFAAVPDDPSGHVDGMKCDERGNVWVTGPGGVWVLDREGRHLGTVLVPERVGNLHWGGDDRRTLFVAASTGLYRLDAAIAGRREPFMR
jgi:gluconolactonase